MTGDEHLTADADLTDLDWFKASASSGTGGCLEVAILPNSSGRLAVRDSKVTNGPSLVLRSVAFAALVNGVSAGTI
ncbi:DUF397 domain-containing protein [Streptomyces sp. NPDC001868]|uniref:DUF397 domain-containing protein n=1 Tax=Streptomyces sp. NPDC001868 TaxID=3154401 RepID=UPI0033213BFC